MFEWLLMTESAPVQEPNLASQLITLYFPAFHAEVPHTFGYIIVPSPTYSKVLIQDEP